MTKTEAINYFNGTSKLAKTIGISYEAVRQWPEKIPYLRQLHIEKLTNGVLKADADKKAS